ncbi:MAG: TonB-dependent receptor, partial [Pedobacter sp.]|nr:TonB-dependent receptor [Pedobacter sp.]
MKNKLVLFFGFFTLLASVIAFKIDDDPFSAILKKLDDYSSKYPQEKVYLQLDKPYYAVGDDIWFKGYVVNTKTQAPSIISSILYVELINDKDSIATKLKLPIGGGITWGDFKLTDSLKEGNYRIRAYTNYMRNFGSDFFFDKTIKIGNSWTNKVFTKTDYSFITVDGIDKTKAKIHFEDKNGLPYVQNDVSFQVDVDYRNVKKGKVKTNSNGDVEIDFSSGQSSSATTGKITATLKLPNKEEVTKIIPIVSTSNQVDVQFMPEGGTFLEGIPTRMAVKAVNSTGRGAIITGQVIDANGKEITSFGSDSLGMGSFVLTLLPDLIYTTKIKFSDGSDKEFKLPIIQKSGFGLKLSNSDSSNVYLKIFATADRVSGEELKIVAQQAGNLLYVSKAKMDKQVLSAVIPKSKLLSGVVQFTLFSAQNEPIAERLIFIKSKERLMDIDLNTAKVSNSIQGKSTFDFIAKNDQTPIIGSFSVSVTNASKVVPDIANESNILTSMLLTSDLAGYVENPNYYFLKDDAKTNEDLDNLMLTQGYRRFTWKNVLSNIQPAMTFKAETSLTISGTVTKGKKPVVGGHVMLLSTKGTQFILDTVTNAEGKFVFDNLAYIDSTKFVVQARTSSDRKFVDILVDPAPNQIVTKNKNSADIEVNVNDVLMKYIKGNDRYLNEMVRLGLVDRTIQLNEVTIVQKKNPAKNSSNLNGAGNADFVLGSDQLGTCPTLIICLQGRLPGVIFRGNVPYTTRSPNTPMQIRVDDIQSDPDFLDGISPSDVESIEVLKSISYTSIYGGAGSGGVLLITTKRGGGGSYSRYAPGVVSLSPKGFYIARDFYAPKYDDPAKSPRVDLRSTIYWNPQVVAKGNKGANFDFYNASEPGTYRVVIEGIDAMGQLGR